MIAFSIISFLLSFHCFISRHQLFRQADAAAIVIFSFISDIDIALAICHFYSLSALFRSYLFSEFLLHSFDYAIFHISWHYISSSIFKRFQLIII